MNVVKHNRSTKILVLGAGELGMAVLRPLSKRAAGQPPASVTVLLRPSSLMSSSHDKAERLAELKALGIELLAGDLESDSVSELAALFEPFDAVINCSGFIGGKGTQLKITRAVLDAKVRRYFPWQFGVDYDEVGKGSGQDVWDEQLDVRQLLRSQDATDWVIVSTGMFTSYLFEPSFGVVDMANRTVFALGDWDNAVTLTTPEDIGLLTAEIFFSEPEIANQVIYVAGDTITYSQLAEMLETITGQNIRREKLSLARLKSDVLASHGETASKYRLAFARKKGVSWDKNKTFNVQKGINVKSVPQWLEENSADLPFLQHDIEA